MFQNGFQKCDDEFDVLLSENDMSIVVPTRMDDYGGNSSARFFRMLLNTSLSFPNSEIVVVDWGSDDGGVGEIRSYMDKFHLNNVKLVHVSQNITNTYPFFMEYIAKNVGIRSSTKQWVLTINQDALIPPELARFLRFGQLNEFVFYRTRRVEESYYKRRVVSDRNPCHQSCFVDTPPHSIDVHTHHKTCRKIHTSAPGDFIMATKYNWMRVGGFQESVNKSEVGIDVIMGYKFVFYGIGEQFLVEPCVILHQTHRFDRGYRSKPGSNENIKKVHDCVKDFITKNLLNGSCFKTNPPTWGLIV